MTADVDLLPLPLPWSDVRPNGRRWLFKLEDRPRVEEYARANVAHATAAKDAEIEALRAEVERLWDRDETMLRAYMEREAALIRRVQEAEAHAERLAEALREIEALSPLVGVSAARTIARASLHPTAAQRKNNG